jgi:hypothetical protein
MERVEKELHRKNKLNKTDQDIDDYLEENERGDLEDDEALDMSALNQDYDNGGTDEIENYDEDN